MIRRRSRAREAVAALAVALGLVGCDRCTSPEDDAAPAARVSLPEAWTMGVTAEHELTLPPPCVLRAELLTTVLPRETRLVSERSTLGWLLVAEGAVLPSWKMDASGLIEMKLGLTRAHAAPWPEQSDEPALAMAHGRWLSLLPRGGALDAWRDGATEATGLRATPADVLCQESLCVIAGVEVRASPADGATLIVGSPDQAIAGWERAHVEPIESGSQLERIHALSGAGSPWTVDLSWAAPGRVRFVRATSAGREPGASLTIPGELMASLAGTAKRLPMAASAMGSADSCAAEHGGLLLSRLERPNLPLRSALRGRRVELRPLAGGVLVTWLSAVRCESSLTLLHAAVLRNDGELVGAVSSVGDATSYAVASAGEEADVWLRDGNRLTWARMRCPLPPADR